MRADECLFLGGNRSCSGHHRNDRFDPQPTWACPAWA